MGLFEIRHQGDVNELLFRDIANNNLTDELNEKITELHYCVGEEEIFLKFCKALETNSDITSLKISGIFLSSQGFSSLNELLLRNRSIFELRLKSLYEKFDNMRLENIINDALCEIDSSVRILHIEYCNLTQEGMGRITDFLNRNQKLEYLSFRQFRLGGSELAFKSFVNFGEAVKNHRSLKYLSFHDCFHAFGPDIVLVLSDAIRENKVLRTLKLSNIGILDDKTIDQDRSKFLFKLGFDVAKSAIVRFDRSKVELETSCFLALANALSANTTLEELDLSNHVVRRGSLLVFLPSLIKNYTLRVLNLNGNDHGLTGNIKLLSKIIELNTGLESLSLDNCYLGSGLKSKKELSYIISALKKNKNLTSLSLKNNRLTNVDINSISTILEKNKALCRIEIDETYHKEIMESSSVELNLIERKLKGNIEIINSERRILLFRFVKNFDIKENNFASSLRHIMEMADCEPRKVSDLNQKEVVQNTSCTLM